MTSTRLDAPDVTQPAGTAPEPRGYFLVRSDPAETARYETYCAGLFRLPAGVGARTLVHAAPIATPTRPGPSFRLTIVELPTFAHLRGLLARPEHDVLRRENAPEGLGRSWAMPGVLPAPHPFPPATEPCAYILTRTTVKDAALLERYQPLVASLIGAHGGRFLVRTDAVQIVSGAPDA